MGANFLNTLNILFKPTTCCCFAAAPMTHFAVIDFRYKKRRQHKTLEGMTYVSFSKDFNTATVTRPDKTSSSFPLLPTGKKVCVLG